MEQREFQLPVLLKSLFFFLSLLTYCYDLNPRWVWVTLLICCNNQGQVVWSSTSSNAGLTCSTCPLNKLSAADPLNHLAPSEGLNGVNH